MSRPGEVETASATRPHGRPLQFSLTTLLATVAGVAVIAAGGSFGIMGLVASVVVAGVGGSSLARRVRAYRVAFYSLAATEGAVLSFFVAAAILEPLTFEGVFLVTVPCLSVVLAARVLRSQILGPDKGLPWLAAVLAPYLVAYFTWFAVFPVEAVIHRLDVEPASFLVKSILLVGLVVTIGMPILGYICIFCCLSLRAIAMPHEDATRLKQPAETTEDRPDEAML